MRAALAVLLALATVVLVALLAQYNPLAMELSPFTWLCLALFLGFYAAIVVSLTACRRHPETVGKLWLAAGSCAITLLGGDLILNRVLEVHRYPKLVNDLVVHHRLEPGAVSEMRSNEFRATLHVNSLGLRGPEIATEKDAGVYRILMLGDSMTMGEGVADDQTFSVLLERSLTDALGRRVQVLNAGVDSYTPLLAYLALRTRLIDLKPDAVVLNFDMSDLVQESYYRTLARFGPDGDVLAVPNPEGGRTLGRSITRWVSRNLYALRLVFLSLQDRLREGKATLNDAVVSRMSDSLLLHTLAQDAEDRTDQWRAVFDSMERIQELCGRHSALFVVTIYPWGHQVNDDEWLPGRWNWMPEGARASDAPFRAVGEFCRRSDIPFVDATPAFRASAGGERLFFRWDMHWTPAGHQVMGRVLQSYFEELLARVADRPAGSA